MIGLNNISPDEARRQLLACCGSSRWVAQMEAARPFEAAAAVKQMADAVWDRMEREDILEAFAAHPRIGDREALRSKFAHDRFAAGEQSGAAGASEEVLDALAEANRAYQARFGYIFIVCATGKTAEEMLGLLRVRLRNHPSVELGIAANEQRKIMHIRIDKMLASSPS